MRPFKSFPFLFRRVLLHTISVNLFRQLNTFWAHASIVVNSLVAGVDLNLLTFPLSILFRSTGATLVLLHR